MKFQSKALPNYARSVLVPTQTDGVCIAGLISIWEKKPPRKQTR